MIKEIISQYGGHALDTKNWHISQATKFYSLIPRQLVWHFLWTLPQVRNSCEFCWEAMERCCGFVCNKHTWLNVWEVSEDCIKCFLNMLLWLFMKALQLWLLRKRCEYKLLETNSNQQKTELWLRESFDHLYLQK